MVTSEERMKILKMVEEGKIGVEDAAKLLATLEGNAARRKSTLHPLNLPRDPRSLRVLVNDARGGKRRVNISLPMALVDAGLNIASNYMDQDTEEQAAAIIEAIRTGTTGKVLDYFDDGDGEHVQIFIE